MRPEFARAIAPVIIAAIDFLDRLPTLQRSEATSERGKVERAIQLAESRLQGQDSWRRAKYAIAALIDEECIEASWVGREYWVDHSLEVQYFPENQKIAHDNFYIQANEAIAQRDHDALEVFFLCVLLGFRGIYGDIDAKDHALRERALEFVSTHRMPASLEAWIQRTGSSFSTRLKQEIVDASVEAEGAPPLDAKSNLVSSLLFSIICVGALAGYLLIQLFVLSQ
jgi:type VI secretion system protein ImpK